ncbi:hypothetical protein DWG24_05340 [Dickeya zeae]|uniref:Uncharacterized protein n=1 Tax=Dickeya zeae TaxID=204042 RepID=A0AAE6YYK5_9GAMM|nr:hypothetical protein DWG24_05340 [Dickeya zeae]
MMARQDKRMFTSILRRFLLFLVIIYNGYYKYDLFLWGGDLSESLMMCSSNRLYIQIPLGVT